MNRARQPAPAFTLIELLVVMAIISVLISVLVPALAGARKSSRGLLCETRLRNLGQAMSAYADTYDSAAPLGESDNMHYAASVLPGLGYGTMNTVSAYFRRDDEDNQERFLAIIAEMPALQCPDFPNEAQRLDFVVNAFGMPYTLGQDAGEPGDGPASNPTENRTLFLQLTRLEQSASSTIYLTEAHKDLPTDNPLLHDLFSAVQLPLASFPRIANDLRHPGGLNALFFDTHVERMTHRAMDVGWPHPLGARLRYFTTLP